MLSLIVDVVRAKRRLTARARLGGRMRYSRPFVIGPRIRAARGASLVAAERVSLGADCTLMARLEIGADVMVSSGVAFIGDDHPFQDLPGPLTMNPARPLATIRLEGDNLVGYGAILLGSLTVGRGAVVGAGAVVTGDLEPDTVYAGTPARAVSPRRRGSQPDGHRDNGAS